MDPPADDLDIDLLYQLQLQSQQQQHNAVAQALLGSPIFPAPFWPLHAVQQSVPFMLEALPPASQPPVSEVREEASPAIQAVPTQRQRRSAAEVAAGVPARSNGRSRPARQRNALAAAARKTVQRVLAQPRGSAAAAFVDDQAADDGNEQDEPEQAKEWSMTVSYEGGNVPAEWHSTLSSQFTQDDRCAARAVRLHILCVRICA